MGSHGLHLSLICIICWFSLLKSFLVLISGGFQLKQHESQFWPRERLWNWQVQTVYLLEIGVVGVHEGQRTLEDIDLGKHFVDGALVIAVADLQREHEFLDLVFNVVEISPWDEVTLLFPNGRLHGSQALPVEQRDTLNLFIRIWRHRTVWASDIQEQWTNIALGGLPDLPLEKRVQIVSFANGFGALNGSVPDPGLGLEEWPLGHEVEQPVDSSIALPVLLGKRPNTRVVDARGRRDRWQRLLQNSHSVEYVHSLAMRQIPRSLFRLTALGCTTILTDWCHLYYLLVWLVL